MKYDCNKTLDYSHEVYRMCTVYNNCEECPLRTLDTGCPTVQFITQKAIAIVQKWSDDHPEQPKITIEEQNFLEAFKDESLLIARYGSGLRLMHGGSWIDLRGIMFSFININQPWTIGDLLKLEVEHETN